jgi:uncharacterized protein (TIGR02217 family)
MAFIEDSFPSDYDYGSGFETDYAVDVVTTIGGAEYRSQRHPYPILKLDIDFTRQRDDVIKRILDLNNRAGGMMDAFRVKNWNEYSTNNYRDTPTALDQPVSVDAATGKYQLMRWYGNPAVATCRRRRIRKPVAGSALIGVGGAAYPVGQFTVDYTTGLVTVSANKARAITGITQAAAAVLTVGTHTFAVGESVVISGVVGMTQINNRRALITAISGTTITVAINSTVFIAYTSGGTVQTNPIAVEAVTGGCLFDIPMRFNDDLSGSFMAYGVLSVSGTELIEVLNP